MAAGLGVVWEIVTASKAMNTEVEGHTALKPLQDNDW
jgi:hypothetical protein